MKNKSQKNDKSQDQIFLTRSTAPFVEIPPFNPETPWDDDFAFKPLVQKGVLWHSCRGMKTLFLPMAVTQIPRDPQFSQGRMHYDYNAILFKTMKEMKQACTQYGTNPPYTMGLIQVLSQADWLIPYNWEMIARTWYPPQKF